MSLRIFGAVLIVLGCGGFGAILVRNDRLAEKSLRSLCAGLDFMSSELQYRLTPLPDLCRMAGEELGGGVGAVFSALAMALEDQISPDVNACMHAALAKNPNRCLFPNPGDKPGPVRPGGPASWLGSDPDRVPGAFGGTGRRTGPAPPELQDPEPLRRGGPGHSLFVAYGY